MNHAQEAERLLKTALSDQYVKSPAGYDASVLVTQRAQVHATLALAEQQRIANVFELSRIESENHCTPRDALNAIYDTSDPDYLETLPEIMESLELGDTK